MTYARVANWPTDLPGAVMLGSDYDSTYVTDSPMVLLQQVLELLDSQAILPEKLYVPYRNNAAPYITMAMLEEMWEDQETTYLVFYPGPEYIQAVREQLTYIYSMDAEGEPMVARSAIARNVMFVNGRTDYVSQRVRQCRQYVVDGTIAPIGGGRECQALEWADIQAWSKRRAEKRLIAFLDNQKATRKRIVESNLYSAKNDMKVFRQRAYEEARKVENLSLEYDALVRIDLAQDNTQRDNDIRELMTYENLADIEIEGETVIFNTGPLNIKEPDGSGCVRPIGRYSVRVGMEDASAVFTSLDNKIDKDMYRDSYGSDERLIPHPHCGTDGNPCMGNMANALSDLTISGDILGIWQIILSFLTSYNPNDSWGQRSRYWPKFMADGVTPAPTMTKCHICGKEYDSRIGQTDENGEAFEDVDIVCGICGQPTCSNCIKFVEEDDEEYCDDCAQKLYCSLCDTHHGKDTDFVVCKHCGNRVCEEYAIQSEHQYNGAEIWFCQEDCQENWEDNNYYDGQEPDTDCWECGSEIRMANAVKGRGLVDGEEKYFCDECCRENWEDCNEYDEGTIQEDAADVVITAETPYYQNVDELLAAVDAAVITEVEEVANEI